MNKPLKTQSAPNRIAALFAPPSVRWDRIREVRRKIAAGDYDRPEVLAALVERVIEDVQ